MNNEFCGLLEYYAVQSGNYAVQSGNYAVQSGNYAVQSGNSILTFWENR